MRLEQEIAKHLNLETDDVSDVIAEFLMRLHKGLYEYKGLNGDFIGEQLHWDLSKMGFYHLLGFLDMFADRYGWESGTANEYLLRLGGSEEWGLYKRQMETWKENSVD